MEPRTANKRARQACEPCRRKKTKCPGERPECSHCQRLSQLCFYDAPAGEPDQGRHNRKLEYRMDHIEGKLDQLLSRLSPGRSPCSREGLPAAHPTPPSTLLPAEMSVALSELSSDELRDEPVMEDPMLIQTGQLYLKWCHNQPITLFSEDNFLPLLRHRSRELLLAIEALSLRFPPRTLTADERDLMHNKADESRRIVMASVSDESIELPTLQTLCLLSLVDFTEGRTARAELHLGIAETVAQRIIHAQCKGGRVPQAELEHCIRSIYFLKNLQTRSALAFAAATSAATSTNTPPSPFLSGTNGLRQLTTTTWSGYSFAPEHPSGNQSTTDASIIAYTHLLGEIWRATQSYAANQTVPSTPPWTTQSDYTTISLRHLEVESLIPLQYRVSANKFQDYSPGALQQRRNYWGPWLFLQIVYSVIPCILNHSFLLSLRLRNFKHLMPQSFIRQSFEHITRHACWIVHFLDLLEKSEFQVSDPTLGYCVLVVATIHLQHSFVQDLALRHKAQTGLRKCTRFLQKMGSTWPNVKNMADNFAKLEDSIKTLRSTAEPSAQPLWSIDSQLLWKVLIYETAGCPGATFDQSMLGPSLVSTTEFPPPIPSQTATELNLVGSAGISGHKSVAPENQPFPPSEDETTERAASEWHWNNQYTDMFYGMGDQDSLFLRAPDFEMAIGNHLGTNLE